ncbi:MAG: hypothetical protein BGO83_21765 [Devosia sp. 66-14]|nr:MAG: hypothetical protein ABS47_25860 [Devosia sp. SCN 66-27]OJX26508.1 MAG: hypothetical protein BGO83_21765 [Devosia sp. 66-14]
MREFEIMRDAVLAGPTPAEVVALVRLAEHGASVPPHLTMSMVAKGWLMIADEGTPLITLAGRTLVERAELVDIELLAGVPSTLASWGTPQVA